MKTRVLVFLAVLVSALAAPALAQTPNTASIVVIVVDQTGAVVGDANVTVMNSATGASRDVVSGADGSATIAALPLTGTYAVHVTKAGFTAEDASELTLRAGETATVKVSLVASGGKTEVTVYGTAEGVRADPQIGRRSTAPDRRDADPRPQGDHAAAAQLRVPAGQREPAISSSTQTYFITGAGSRRTTTFTLDGANNDEAGAARR